MVVVVDISLQTNKVAALSRSYAMAIAGQIIAPLYCLLVSLFFDVIIIFFESRIMFFYCGWLVMQERRYR